MPKIYTKEELGNLNSTQRDGTINADKTFVLINGNAYLLADLFNVKAPKLGAVKKGKKEKVLGAVKKLVKRKKK